MKIAVTLMAGLICLQTCACHSMDRTNHPAPPPGIPASKMKITIGTQVFTATLSDNETAAAFKAMLPLSIRMTELNGNEKYGDLSADLPVNASNPGTIQSGDLMMYGSRILVLFYKTFPTSYSYTKLGRVDDPAGLAAALGSGNVTVRFELE